MTGMSTDTFVSHVAGHAGVSPQRAERAARAVLTGLGAYLTPATRQYIADELPDPLAAELLAGGREGTGIPLEERVIEPGTSAGRARELIASVCHVLAEELSSRALRTLRLAAPITIAPLLAEPAAEVTGPPAMVRRDDTISSGQPGSRRPISGTRPPGAQTGSVADPNPHAGTKLSSSTGTTQERRHETFAEGKPGYDRPLSGPRH